MGVLDQEKVNRIKQHLRWNPRGLTISDLTSKLDMNRNLVAKYLDILLISGQVEMQVIGAAKVYFLSHRIPISAMLEFSSDYVIVLNTDQRVIQLNEPALQILGKKKEEIIGEKAADIDNPFFRCLKAIDTRIDEQATGDRITDIHCIINDETRYYRVKQVPTVFEDGDQGLTFIIEDITTQKSFEDSLKISEARYRGIVEDQTDFITRFRPDGRLLFVNEAYARYLGKEPAELRESYHIPGILNEYRSTIDDAIRSLTRDHTVTTVECRVSGPDNRISWNTWTIRALFNNEGTVHECQGVGRDNTEKREAATKINRYIKTMEFLSQTGMAMMDIGEGDDIFSYVANQIHSLVQGYVVWIAIYDESNQKVFFKSFLGDEVAINATRTMTGMELEDMVFPIESRETTFLLQNRRLIQTPPLHELLKTKIPEDVCRKMEEEAGGIDSYMMGLISKGRIVGNVGISLKKGSRLPDRELIEAFIRQAAIAIDRRIAEDALKKSEQIYRSVIENIQDMFYRTDKEGKLILASPSWATVLGYESLDECLGKDIAESFYMEPEIRKQFRDAVYREGEVRNYESVLKKKDGTPLPVAATSHLYYDDSREILGIEGIFRDISQQRKAIEQIKTHISEMEFFSRKLQEFIELPPGSDLYHAIGTGLEEILPDAAITVNAFDPSSGKLTIKAVFNENVRTCTTQYGGGPFLGMEIPAGETSPEGLKTVKIHLLQKNIHDYISRQVPAEACQKILDVLDLGDFYSVGLIWRGQIYGNITIGVRKGSEIPNASLIEVYAKAASIALQRLSTEQALKQKEVDAVRSLKFLSKAAMAFVNMRDDEDIYRLITGMVHQYCPDLVVAICSLNAARGVLNLRSVSGVDEGTFAKIREMGVDLFSLSFPIATDLSFQEIVTRQSLIDGPERFYTLFFGQVPEDTCEEIERLFGYQRCYIMGLVCKGEILGSIILVVRKGMVLKDKETLEAFISQTALALQSYHTRMRII